jgi:6-phosphofructo-2-kinase
MLAQYYKNRKKKTLPVLKTDKDLEVEGLARLSIDLPSFQVTDEPESVLRTSPPTSRPNSPFVNNIQSRRPKVEDSSLLYRHSVGFDVPGAVHTIMTPSKICI